MIELTIFVIAVIFEGFFSGSEIAIVSSDNSHLLSLARKNNKKAVLLLNVKENPIKFLSVCLIGTNLSAATASFTGTLFFLEHLHQYEKFAIFFIIPTMMLLGEIIPKTVYSKYANTTSLIVISPIILLSKILKPAILFLEKWNSIISAIFKKEEKIITKGEFELILEKEKHCLPEHLQDIIVRFKEKKDIENAIFGENND